MDLAGTLLASPGRSGCLSIWAGGGVVGGEGLAQGLPTATTATTGNTAPGLGCTLRRGNLGTTLVFTQLQPTTHTNDNEIQK